MMPTAESESRPKARNEAMMRTDSMWCFICSSVLFVGECVKVRLTEGRSSPQAGRC